MKKESNPVISNQVGVHENILPLIERYSMTEFKKPYSEESIKSFQQIKEWILLKGNKSLILDMGCGVGESSFHLGKKYPDCLVVGIDKSLDRLERNNSFKKELPVNILLVRGDLIDLWRMFFENKSDFKIKKQYILYPNPYPKKKHLKLRWYGQPVFSSIMNLSCPIELRSNWSQYLEDFLYASKVFYPNLDGKVEQFIPEICVTPFERKFLNSSQSLYRLVIKPLS
jgi:tRNA G46 methylase TrmB